MSRADIERRAGEAVARLVEANHCGTVSYVRLPKRGAYPWINLPLAECVDGAGVLVPQADPKLLDMVVENVRAEMSRVIVEEFTR